MANCIAKWIQRVLDTRRVNPLLHPTTHKAQKEKGGHTQSSNTKNYKFKFNCDQYSTYQFFTKKGKTPLRKETPEVKHSHDTNAKQDQKSQNYAFRYKYNNKNYKNKNNFQNNDRSTFNPKWSNKTYFKGSNGWFYELKNKNA